MCALFSHLNISVVSMNDLRLGQLMWMIVMMKCQLYLASTSHPVNIFNKQILLCLYSFYLFYLFCIIQLCCRMNRSRESASQSLSINQSIILELFNSCTPLNALFSCIPSSVSDGMSISDTIINHHSPISLSLYNRNAIHLLWIESEKEDLINQSSLSLILFIINSFESARAKPKPKWEPPLRAPYPSLMDWSRIRSHSSFTQSFLLSNVIESHVSNAVRYNWMDMREGRLERMNLPSSFPTPSCIIIDSTELEICSIWLTSDIQNPDGWRDNRCSEGVISPLLRMIQSSRE